MKCINCGAEGKEGARFCEACGTPLEAPIEEKKPEAPAEEAAKPAEALEEKQNDAPPAQAEQAPPPKKKSAKKIALAATALVLVVALVAALFQWGPVANAFRKMTMSPEDYLSYVHSHTASSLTDSLLEALAAEPKDLSTTTETTLALGEGAKELLAGIGLTLDPLPSASASTTVSVKTENGCLKSGYTSALKLNGEPVATLSYLYDEKENAVFFEIPELNEKAVKLPLPKLTLSEEAEDRMENVQGSLRRIRKALPDAETYRELTGKYLSIVFKHMKDVKCEAGTLTVAEVSQSCDVYTGVLDGESIQKAAEEILETLKNDETVKTHLKKMMEALEMSDDFDDAWEDYQEAIFDAMKAVKDDPLEADRVKIDYCGYVDGTGNLCGYEFAVDNELFAPSFKNLRAVNHSQFATELSFFADEAGFALQGKGSTEGGKLNADYAFDLLTPDISLECFTVKLSDFDVPAMAQSRVNGTATLRIGEGLANLIFLGERPDSNPLKDFALELQFSAPNAKEASAACSFLYKEKAVLSVSSSAKISAPAQLPSFKDAVNGGDAEAMAQWNEETLQKLPSLKDALLAIGFDEATADALAASLENGGTADNRGDDPYDDWGDLEGGLQVGTEELEDLWDDFEEFSL